MKRIAPLLLVLGLVVAATSAQGSDYVVVVFSKHSPALKLASFDKQTDTYRFKGAIALVGTIYVEFDIAANSKMTGYVTIEKFVPDKSELSKLPAVISGPYAGPVEYVSLDATNKKLEPVFGGEAAYTRISHGTKHTVNARVRVLLDNYSTDVECDARGYSAHVVSISPTAELVDVPSNTEPAGC